MIFSYEGAGMNYEAFGSGDRVLVLLHGWGGSTESWIPVTRDFQKDFRVIAVDFPGFGKSPEPAVGWSVDEYARLTAAFLRSLNAKKLYLIAHSFGGRVALAVNRDDPVLIHKQILTGCAGLPPKKSEKEKLSVRAVHMVSALADNRLTRAVAGDKAIDKARDKMRNVFGSSDYKNASPLMKETFQKVIAQDLTDCLGRVKASTLLVWGENDTATPIWMGREMEKSIRDAGLVVFEGAGHYAYLEQYARFRAIAENFFSDTDA